METRFFNTNYEGTLINNDENPFTIFKVFLDYSFDKRGILNIHTFNVNDNITCFHSFVLPRIYKFVQSNKTYKVSIGTFTLGESFVKEFEKIDIENFEHILTLVEISESFDNNYMTNSISKKEFLK